MWSSTFQLLFFPAPCIRALCNVTFQCLSRKKCTRGLSPCTFGWYFPVLLDLWLGPMSDFGPRKDSRCHANKGLKCARICFREGGLAMLPGTFVLTRRRISPRGLGGGCCLFHLELRMRHVEETVEPAGFRTRQSCSANPSQGQPIPR